MDSERIAQVKVALAAAQAEATDYRAKYGDTVRASRLPAALALVEAGEAA
jgi:hypothetical protein